MALQRLGDRCSNYTEIAVGLDTRVYLKKEKIILFGLPAFPR